MSDSSTPDRDDGETDVTNAAALLEKLKLLPLRERELNLKAQSGYSYESTDTLVKMFDDNVRQAKEAIALLRSPARPTLPLLPSRRFRCSALPLSTDVR